MFFNCTSFNRALPSTILSNFCANYGKEKQYPISGIVAMAEIIDVSDDAMAALSKHD